MRLRSLGVCRSQLRRRAGGVGLQSGRDEPCHLLGQQHEFARARAGQSSDSGHRAVHLHVLFVPRSSVGALAIVDRRVGLDGASPVVRTWPADAIDLVGQGNYDTFTRRQPEVRGSVSALGPCSSSVPAPWATASRWGSTWSIWTAGKSCCTRSYPAVSIPCRLAARPRPPVDSLANRPAEVGGQFLHRRCLSRHGHGAD